MIVKNNTTMGFSELKKWLRHRHPLILIDRVLHYLPGKELSAVMVISGNDDTLAGHFPERAIYPGSHLIQAMSQCGIILLQLSTSKLEEDELTLIGGVSAKFHNITVPGDSLNIHIKVDRLYKNSMFFSGCAKVGDKKIISISANIARVNVEAVGDVLW